MDIFSVEFTIGELQLLRQSLDVITINGKDAKYLAALQTKLENEIAEINMQLKHAELKKQQQLIKALEVDKKITNKDK